MNAILASGRPFATWESSLSPWKDSRCGSPSYGLCCSEWWLELVSGDSWLVTIIAHQRNCSSPSGLFASVTPPVKKITRSPGARRAGPRKKSELEIRPALQDRLAPVLQGLFYFLEELVGDRAVHHAVVVPQLDVAHRADGDGMLANP